MTSWYVPSAFVTYVRAVSHSHRSSAGVKITGASAGDWPSWMARGISVRLSSSQNSAIGAAWKRPSTSGAPATSFQSHRNTRRSSRSRVRETPSGSTPRRCSSVTGKCSGSSAMHVIRNGLMPFRRWRANSRSERQRSITRGGRRSAYNVS